MLTDTQLNQNPPYLGTPSVLQQLRATFSHPDPRDWPHMVGAIVAIRVL